MNTVGERAAYTADESQNPILVVKDEGLGKKDTKRKYSGNEDCKVKSLLYVTHQQLSFIKSLVTGGSRWVPEFQTSERDCLYSEQAGSVLDASVQ